MTHIVGRVMANDVVMEHWTVYASPTDYVGKYVARKFLIMNADPVPTTDIIVVDSLDAVRQAIFERNPNLIQIPRAPGDKLAIVETWI
jgi:hypothetical protein